MLPHDVVEADTLRVGGQDIELATNTTIYVRPRRRMDVAVCAQYTCSSAVGIFREVWPRPCDFDLVIHVHFMAQ
jgi:hypothetical protein